MVFRSDNELWYNIWKKDKVGFHKQTVNTYLLKYHKQLGDLTTKRVLVPLCGKDIDMMWFLNQGSHVIGVELSPIAVNAFFSENKLTYHKRKIFMPPFTIYQHHLLKLYCGDFFNLQRKNIRHIDVVYDKAALVALPKTKRIDYANKLATLMPIGCQMLLMAVEFKSHITDSPPYSITNKEIHFLFKKKFNIKLLLHKKNIPMPPHLKNRRITNTHRRVYLLTRSEGFTFLENFDLVYP